MLRNGVEQAAMRRTFGRTDLKVFPIGFGGIPIQRNSEQESIALVHEAIEQGINFFDSARGYTDSEQKIGLGIKGFRDKVILATKTMARTKEGMDKDIETSLRNFGADYIDLYQCHNVRSDEELATLLGPNGGFEALVRAQQEGKIRYIGLTGHKPEMVLKTLKAFPFASVQFPFNYLEQQNKAEVIEVAKQKQLGVIIMKPLAGGAIRRGDLALRFLLEKELGVLIPGMDSIAQVKKNSGLVKEFVPLSEAELQELDDDVKELEDNFCRRCEYCMPCPSGVNIPSAFLLEGYYHRYNLPEWAIERYNSSTGTADACTECGICESKCPYGLPIREKLKKAHVTLYKHS